MRWIAFAFITGLILAVAGTGIRVASAPHTHETPFGGGGGIPSRLRSTNAVKVPPVVPRSAEARTTNSKQNGPSGGRPQIIGVELQILHRRCS